MNTEEFTEAARTVAARWPGAEVTSSSTLNRLSVVVDGTTVGWVDVKTGEVTRHERTGKVW